MMPLLLPPKASVDMIPLNNTMVPMGIETWGLKKEKNTSPTKAGTTISQIIFWDKTNSPVRSQFWKTEAK